ncbi:MAG TPA: Gfo/Idh/MocA family oxidoreductase [Tepidisphaeraceae bacterium]|nr:Gfo/Idh/MocA family oxidoreductase [Tepidisphaeraceae bacterium]
MAETVRVGIIGAGWPGQQHAKGYDASGGFKIVALADLIPLRREKLQAEHSIAKLYAEARELLADETIHAVSICLPTFLHASTAIAALKAGKHVICEKPPAMSAKEAKQIEAAARKAGKVLLYGFQRRFGGHEQAAKQAIAKGYAGEIYHARAGWMRTRGVPIGTGWFTDKSRSGGGALIDIGIHALDLAWHLLGQPRPLSAFGVTESRFTGLAPKDAKYDVDDAAFALIRFEGGKSMELSTSWAINQPPQQQGLFCRLNGDKGAVDVYTPHGAIIYRSFDAKGEAKPSPLKPPKTVLHAALMRHFRECILGKAQPIVGAAEGVQLMAMIDAIYRSGETGKSVDIR